MLFPYVFSLFISLYKLLHNTLNTFRVIENTLFDVKMNVVIIKKNDKNLIEV